MGFGHSVKEWRERRGLSQARLAELAGVDQPYVSNLEREKFTPTIKTAIALARALDVSLDELAASVDLVSGRAA